MELVIAELARYLFVLFIVIYAFFCFHAFVGRTGEKKEGVFRIQKILTVLIFLTCAAVLLAENPDIKTAILLGLMLVFYFTFTGIYPIIYKGMSRLILNNMMFCMMIGLVMLTRLDADMAMKQLIFAAASMGICLLVPFFIERYTFWEHLGLPYALVGLMLLLLVFVIGVEHNGAKNWITFGGFELQPSEFVKIIYVFFIAAMLSKNTTFKRVIFVSLLAAMHVGVLVMEKDLGGALIFFMTYLAMLYVASMNPVYLILGFGAGAVAATIAYRLFTHVRTRVTAWRDPWGHISDAGYQICRSLFAIGTGGIIGMGLGQGMPQSVPVVESDFIFAAICEEFGVVFAICLILVYISSYIMFVNIAMKMKKSFYKLTAFGLSVVYIFQVFICIGGATKFIPSTGVTLPLISYGGSSIIATIIIFSVIQGMYVMNEREEVMRREKTSE